MEGGDSFRPSHLAFCPKIRVLKSVKINTESLNSPHLFKKL